MIILIITNKKIWINNNYVLIKHEIKLLIITNMHLKPKIPWLIIAVNLMRIFLIIINPNKPIISSNSSRSKTRKKKILF